MAVLYGKSGSARIVSDMYIGVDGIARKVKSAHIGIDGSAKLFFGGEYTPNINEVVEQCVYGGNILSDVVYPAGRYKVEIAGYPAIDGVSSSNNCFEYEATVNAPFTIVAYCGDVESISALGFAYDTGANGGIFGGGGGKDSVMSSTATEPYGNSLSMYGAVCHFVPLGGRFGTDYLWCFHCAPSPKGGAYGGGAGGRGGRWATASGGTLPRPLDRRGGTGGSGEGGSGGEGGYGTIDGAVGTGVKGNPGSSGTGVGAGTATTGGVAVYNSLVWTEPTRTNFTRNSSYVRVTYLGR